MALLLCPPPSAPRVLRGSAASGLATIVVAVERAKRFRRRHAWHWPVVASSPSAGPPPLAYRCWPARRWQVFRVCGPPCSDFGLRRQVSRLPESPCGRFAASAAGFPSSCSKMPARGDGNSGNPPKIPRTRARRPRNPENPPGTASVPRAAMLRLLGRAEARTSQTES